MNKIIKCSTNRTFQGKPESKITLWNDGKEHKTFFYNDKNVSLGNNWENIELDFETLFEGITIDGYPIAPNLTPLKDNPTGNRSNNTFISHSVAMIDIDSGMRISELKKHFFYKKFGSGFYVSPSNTEQLNKFRVIFLLENDIDSGEEMSLLYSGLIKAFGGIPDSACVDCGRYFNGTINANEKEITNRFLTANATNSIIAHERTIREEHNKRTLEEQNKRESLRLLKYGKNESKLNLQVILDFIKNGSYDFDDHLLSGKFFVAMREAGFSIHDAEEVAPFITNDKAGRVDKFFFDNSLKHITVGTLFYMLGLSKEEQYTCYIKESKIKKYTLDDFDDDGNLKQKS